MTDRRDGMPLSEHTQLYRVMTNGDYPVPADAAQKWVVPVKREEMKRLGWEPATPRGAVSAAEDLRETVTHVIVILGGLAEPWDALDMGERCARAENELRGLLDRPQPRGGVSRALDEEDR